MGSKRWAMRVAVLQSRPGAHWRRRIMGSFIRSNCHAHADSMRHCKARDACLWGVCTTAIAARAAAVDALFVRWSVKDAQITHLLSAFSIARKEPGLQRSSKASSTQSSRGMQNTHSLFRSGRSFECFAALKMRLHAAQCTCWAGRTPLNLVHFVKGNVGFWLGRRKT